MGDLAPVPIDVKALYILVPSDVRWLYAQTKGSGMKVTRKIEPPEMRAEWLDIEIEHVEHTRTKKERLQTELALAEEQERISAVIAWRYGASKIDLVEKLGISRPTLDVWIAQVYETPSELKQVEETLTRNRRLVEREKARQP